MKPPHPLTSALLVLLSTSSLAYGAAVRALEGRELAHLEARQNTRLVTAAASVLKLLKATPFCSSLLSLHDVTSTITFPGQTATTTTTITPSVITTTLATPTITVTGTETVDGSTVTSTTTLQADTATTITTIPGGTIVTTTTLPPTTVTTTSTDSETFTITITSTSYTPTTPPKHKRTASLVPTALAILDKRACSIPKLPPALASYACNVVSSACALVVHPSTTTIKATAIATTITHTSTAQGATSTVTPTDETSTVTSTTSTDITTTVTETPGDITITVTATSPPTTQIATQPGDTITATNTKTVISTRTTTTTAISPPNAACTNGVGNGTTPFYSNAYQIHCGAIEPAGYYTQTTFQGTFQDCLNYCESRNVAGYANWNIYTGQCDAISTDGTDDPSPNPDYNCAYNLNNLNPPSPIQTPTPATRM